MEPFHSGPTSYISLCIHNIDFMSGYKNGAKESDPYHPYLTLISLNFKI